MKNISLTAVAFLVFAGLNNRIMAQCNPVMPINTILIDTATYTGSGGQFLWICTTDTMESGGGGNTFYVESDGIVLGGGGSFTVYLKNCASFDANGGGSNTIYYEPAANIIDAGGGPTLIACANIYFDYTNAPNNNCDTTNCIAPPTAGFTASADTICEAGCVNFNDTSSTIENTSWSWTFPGGTPSSSTNQNPNNICYATAGSYTAQLIVTDSVGSDTATFVITVITCTGLDNKQAPIKLHMMPNPTTGVFTVSGAAGPVQVFDLLGNLVLATRTREVDLSGYPSGIYFIRVGQQTQKLILSK